MNKGIKGWIGQHWFKVVFLLPALVIYVVFLLIPIIDSMGMSLYSGNQLIPDTFVGFDNFKTIIFEDHYRTRVVSAFLNNFYFFTLVTLIQNVIGFVISFILAQRIRGMKLFRKLSFIPTCLSVLVVGFVFRQLLNPIWGIFGSTPWLNEFPIEVLAVAVSWQFIGESILFYSIAIDGIDQDLIEAARIDGASPLQEIWYIILPSVKPVIGIVSLLIFIGDFTQFDIVYAIGTTMANPEFRTDLFGSLFYRTAFSTPVRGGWGVGMGAAVSTIMFFVVTVGVIVWALIFQRREKE